MEGEGEEKSSNGLGDDSDSDTLGSEATKASSSFESREGVEGKGETFGNNATNESRSFESKEGVEGKDKFKILRCTSFKFIVPCQ